MTTYHISLEGDVLKVGFSATLATGDQIVRDAAVQLDAMIASGELSGGSLIKINGRTSVLVSQVLADKLSKLYDAIAFFDPKIGDRGLDRYVVTISNHPEYKVGDTLDIVRCLRRASLTPQQSSIKVVLCGFANTGKTCFRDGLKQALLQIPNAPESYFISGCPDGDGSWYGETARRDLDLAKKLKAEYKARFTPEFAQLKAQEVRGINTPIFIFDVGGRISDENRLIMVQATHAVILVKDQSEIAPWQGFCQSLGLQVVAIICSDYEGVSDVISGETPILRGNVHRLQRGEDVSSRLMVQTLARVLVELI
ncbi:CRISPR-associated protein Csx3 [Nostoc sp. 'Peltigera malacea cyanobiont' DB3992]|uniref:CRISPR-associated protein Csx3 n=1 Tax=Nostoc sp. 'Peltigera malacea cyanobiont' DB3992 TaxID=1206980 RepID=UPI000C04093B|nr:CRISPR-associated protein Csx3 [Nostoc sp. 'Peltigera malacea cyanobiont' DB3992]PHM10368.1 CRISPR-associated protein Csx3 [Nostoc sp. 'Peltigera malacea cyanobiont' DB3992]